MRTRLNAFDERANGDSRALHVDEQEGEPAVLGRLEIGAHHEDAPVGEACVARPDLLSGHVEHVAAELGARAASGQVGAGVRLREPLAPHLLAGQDPAEKALLLTLRAVVDERRSDERRPDPDVDHGGCPDPDVFLGEEKLLERGCAAAAVLLRPAEARPAALVEPPLPPASEADLLFRPLGHAVRWRSPARRRKSTGETAG